MKRGRLFEALYHVVPWQLPRPDAREIRLWQDAEFLIMPRELR